MLPKVSLLVSSKFQGAMSGYLLSFTAGFKIKSHLLTFQLLGLFFSRMSIMNHFFAPSAICVYDTWPKSFWIEISLSSLKNLENIKCFLKDFAHNTCFELSKLNVRLPNWGHLDKVDQSEPPWTKTVDYSHGLFL